MTLARTLSAYFDTNVRSRGLAYARQGRVEVIKGDDHHLVARVQGQLNYNVELRRDGTALNIACPCPAFRKGQPCKHIWAVLHVADQRGFLDGGSGAARIQLLRTSPGGSPAAPPESRPVDEASPEREAPPPKQGVGASHGRGAARSIPHASPTGWRRQLAAFQQRSRLMAQAGGLDPWPTGRELIYVIDAAETTRHQGLVLTLMAAEMPEDGVDRLPRAIHLRRRQLAALPDAEDRHILGLLSGAEDQDDPLPPTLTGSAGDEDYLPHRFRLHPPLGEVVLPLLCRTGRCFLDAAYRRADLTRLTWDEGEPWELTLGVRPSEQVDQYELVAGLTRGPEPLNGDDLILTTGDGFLFFRNRVGRLLNPEAAPWVPLLTQNPPIRFPMAQGDEFLVELLESHGLPRLDLPESMAFEQVEVAPRPRLTLSALRGDSRQREHLKGDLSFDYDGTFVLPEEHRRAVFQADRRRLVVRDVAAERRARDQLAAFGFRERFPDYRGLTHRLELAASKLPRVAPALVAAGWEVDAAGHRYRRADNLKLAVSSGIDWFDLGGVVTYGEQQVELPELLTALKRGETFLKLSDGSFGLIPDEWLKKFGLLARMGTRDGEVIRFGRAQVGLLDALLAAQPDVAVDAQFERARDQLQRFTGVKAADPTPGFRGELRPYQKEGLGWLHALREFGFGGCLADDMGLGKTVMVLALLESRAVERRRTDVAGPPPSLVVVPRSLVFNWRQEAERFTPALRILDHTGLDRSKSGDEFKDFDVILTTYGTLRRDALLFTKLRFDYVILDEAQAIKNAATESAKAARLIPGDHRLALSGTPIENHLGEIWSLFEFLNPGVLGHSALFARTAGPARPINEESAGLLSRALRPFILRRTKEQVAGDIPARFEQTLFCEMEPAQRRLYEELRQHYRTSLLNLIQRKGLMQSKIQVLEALLRLRQASCHPGLIDKERLKESSAKLDLLLPQLEEVIEEGHKALVFSQFTSFLAIVRDRLDRKGLTYEYLDGRTRQREERVRRFQEDDGCRIFLISLKAGGLGLNLTAADYVFLLDPWWNPAVEAQAIDRAHRIGQTRQVFAYRIIARDSVEEKVLSLQESKRALADAIIQADESLMRKISREDLEVILS